MSALSSHNQRRSPLTLPVRPLNQSSGVDVGAAVYKELHYVQMTGAARLNQRVLVAGNHLVNASAPVQKQRDDVRVSFARSHDERTAVSGYWHVRIGAAV